MDKLRFDLEALEVERLDGGAPGLSGLEHMGMGHGATEFAASCGDCYCACYCSYSCAY